MLYRGRINFMTNVLFFELIRISIGKQKVFSHIPSTKEWEQLYLMAKRQTILGTWAFHQSTRS